MKHLLNLAIFTLSISAQAAELPKDLEERARLNLLAGEFSLATNNIGENLKRKDFLEKAKTEISDYEKNTAGFSASAGATAVLAGSGLNVGVFEFHHGLKNVGYAKGAAKPRLDTLKIFLKNPGYTAMSMGPGFGLMGVGSLAMYSAKQKLDEGKVKYLLNNDNAEQLATALAKNMAVIASLDKGEEATYKHALLKEMRRKAKEGDESPINPLQILREAEFKGKSLLSPAELAALAANTADEEAQAKKQSPDELAAEIVRTNAMLEATLVMGAEGSFIQPSLIRTQIRRNKEVLAEINAFKRSQGHTGAVGGSGDGDSNSRDPNARAGDAE